MFHGDPLEEELVHHLAHGQRVVLARRHDVRLHLALGAAPDLAAGLVPGVPEHDLPVAGRDLEWGEGGDDLPVHDVAHVPPAARPGVREGGLRFVLRELPGAPQLVRMDVERGGEAGAGGLGEHPGDVVEGGDPVEPEVSPAGIDGGVHRPLEALFLHAVGHVGAVPGHLPPDERVRARADGLGVGRQVDAGGVGPHLVVVNEPLGDPVAEQQRGHVLRLDRVLHEGVAVVVVPDVVVVEPRLLRRFVFRTHPAVVPLVHQVHAVGIHRGDQDRDGVVEDLVDPGIVAGGETPDDLRRRLARRHLVRVERVTLEEDHLAVGDGLIHLRLRVSARVLEDRVHPLVVVEPREVFRGGDVQHEKRTAERRNAHVLDPDPVALRADELVVLDELVPFGELAVGAHPVPEELLGGRDLGGGLGGEGAEDEGAHEGEEAGDGTGSHGGNDWKGVRRKETEPAGRRGAKNTGGNGSGSERQPPAGIARERETCAGGASPRERGLVRPFLGGVRFASLRSAMPAGGRRSDPYASCRRMAVRRARLGAPRVPVWRPAFQAVRVMTANGGATCAARSAAGAGLETGAPSRRAVR